MCRSFFLSSPLAISLLAFLVRKTLIFAHKLPFLCSIEPPFILAKLSNFNRLLAVLHFEALTLYPSDLLLFILNSNDTLKFSTQTLKTIIKHAI